MELKGRTKLALAGVAAVVAVALAGCGATSKSDQASAGSGGSSSETIVRAADVSDSAKGYAFRLAIDATVSGSSVKITGAGTYSAASHGIAMTLDSIAAGKSVDVQEIGLGSVFYLKEPPAAAVKLPGGKPWLELDFSKAAKGSYFSDLSLADSSQENNPTDVLEYLKAESTHIQNLGQATVDGVPTTHYRATVDLNRAGSGLSPSTHAATQALLRKLPGTILNRTDVPVDVWIDASHFVRQETVTIKATEKGSSDTIDESIKLAVTKYGPEPTPTPPPASETSSLLALLKAEGKTSLISGSPSTTSSSSTTSASTTS
jgi:hypothetical protein